MKEPISKRFCNCIKKVRKTVRARDNKTKESSAIAICVKSVLQTRRKTLHSFRCGRHPKLQTQPMKNRKDK